MRTCHAELSRHNLFPAAGRPRIVICFTPQRHVSSSTSLAIARHTFQGAAAVVVCSGIVVVPGGTSSVEQGWGEAHRTVNMSCSSARGFRPAVVTSQTRPANPSRSAIQRVGGPQAARLAGRCTRRLGWLAVPRDLPSAAGCWRSRHADQPRRDGSWPRGGAEVRMTPRSFCRQGAECRPGDR